MNSSKGCINVVMKNGWLDECTKHMVSINKPKGYYTKEKCIEEAKKHRTSTEWNKKSSRSYAVASRNGWLQECKTYFKK